MDRHEKERKIVHDDLYTMVSFDNIKNLFFWLRMVCEKIGFEKILNMQIEEEKIVEGLPLCYLKFFKKDFEKYIQPIL